MRSRRSVVVGVMVALAVAVPRVHGQAPGPVGAVAEERGPQPISPEAIQKAIDSLGNLEFSVRMNAARTLRRAPAETVAPALIRAVESHRIDLIGPVPIGCKKDPATSKTVRGA